MWIQGFEITSWLFYSTDWIFFAFKFLIIFKWQLEYQIHVEKVQFGESAVSLMISNWFCSSASSICLSIASSVGIKSVGFVSMKNIMSEILPSKNINMNSIIRNSRVLLTSNGYYTDSKNFLIRNLKYGHKYDLNRCFSFLMIILDDRWTELSMN